MPRYHINSETGNPGKCSAVVKCPFGDINNDHWSTKEEAREAYEVRSADGTLPKIVNPRIQAALQRAVEEAQDREETVEAELELAKAEEGKFQSEMNRLKNRIAELKQASQGIDSLMKLKLADGDAIRTLQDLAANVRVNYDQANTRLNEVNVLRPQTSKRINVLNKDLMSARSDRYRAEREADI